MNNFDELTAWVGLCLVPRLGASLMRNLLAHFDTPEAVLQAETEELLQVPGVGKQMAAYILRIDCEKTARLIENWQAQNIELLSWDMPDYPQQLKTVDDAPPLLFKTGDLGKIPPAAVAIVGTREPSADAASFAVKLAAALTRQGWIVLSGLARGIDSYAHQGALAYGQTVAVLGSGVRHIYPPENRPLAAKIWRQGAIFSEVAPHISPHRTQLVARNRIITGLSQVTIVIEAGEKSGALYAARFATKQNRLLATVDYPATGNQQIIANGALSIAPSQAGIDSFIQNIIERGVLPPP